MGVENLLQGTGVLYLADFGATEPSNTDIHEAPSDSVWTNIGLTQDGVTLSVSHEWSELEADQIVDVPDRRLIKREVSIATNMAEAHLEGLQKALAGATIDDTDESAGASASGVHVLEPELINSGVGPPHYRAVLFDGFAPGGFIRRVILRRAVNTSDIESAYKKDEQTLIPVEFHGHYVSAEVAPWRIIDQVAVPTGS